MAMVAPLFLTVLLGMSKASRLLDVQSQLAVAAREGARLAAMDRDGLLQNGQSTNAKITQDIQSFLTANGLPGDEAEVHIVDPDDHTTVFDLDDAANNLELFELRIELPFAAISPPIAGVPDDLSFVSRIVFRNARATIVQ
jgi:Flp pilus assembly protein TadG